MNESKSVPPLLPDPPAGHPGASPAVTTPPDPASGEREPLLDALSAAEAILRQPKRVLHQFRERSAWGLVAGLFGVFLVCAAVYGLVVGMFSGGVQWWAAPAKVAGTLVFSVLLCLPSLYIFACLGGSQARWGELVRLCVGLLVLLALLLIGFAPVAWIFSQSTGSVAAMGVLHLGFGAVATYFGIRFLHAGLLVEGARLGKGIRVWTLILVAVMLQMTTALRPIVGSADTVLPGERRFFVDHWIACLSEAQPRP